MLVEEANPFARRARPFCPRRGFAESWFCGLTRDYRAVNRASRFWGRTRGYIFPSAVERATAQPQRFGGLAYVPLKTLQRLSDQQRLHRLQLSSSRFWACGRCRFSPRSAG
jgi:hypothetical protein